VNFEEKIRQIEEHFRSIDMEQFERNLEIAGIEEIKPIEGCDLALAEIEDWIYDKFLYINTYRYDNQILLAYQNYEYLEVA
jgi:hypothetical protein